MSTPQPQRMAPWAAFSTPVGRSPGRFGVNCSAGVAGLVWLLATGATANAAPPLETETARLPMQGQLEASAVFEFQTSSEGTETAVPLEFASSSTSESSSPRSRSPAR